MLTMHATSKRDGNGYRPMITVRKSNGQMLGSRTSKTLWFIAADTARIWAMIAARDAAKARPDLLRVS